MINCWGNNVIRRQECKSYEYQYQADFFSPLVYYCKLIDQKDTQIVQTQINGRENRFTYLKLAYMLKSLKLIGSDYLVKNATAASINC